MAACYITTRTVRQVRRPLLRLTRSWASWSGRYTKIYLRAMSRQTAPETKESQS